MASTNSQHKSSILYTFLRSGINISPDSLNLLEKVDDPLLKSKEIIKKTSFIASFKSHLTMDVLRNIEDEEIQDIIRNHSKFSKIQLKIIETKSPEIIEERIEDQASKINIYKEDDSKPVEKNDTSLQEEITTVQDVQKNDIPIQKPLKAKKIEKIARKEIKIESSGSTKSVFAYKPQAKEYDVQLKILKDPTGKLFTSGTYNDFYELNIDKFKKLQALMKKRADTHSATNINNILRLSRAVEVATMGFASNIRETKTNKYMLSIEDMTGSINVLINQNPEDNSNYELARRIIDDHMIFVSGQYSPGKNGSSGIIFADYITKIDIPNSHEPKLSPDPLSIAFLSDTHMCSKEFEEKLWNKFIDFINGRTGNRDFAGKIKYIIINGDLVDGVGIYPNQENDLTVKNIYEQFERAAEHLSEIPEHIQIIYGPGNHEPVRNAIPRPALPKKFTQPLIDLGIKCVGNPAMVETHNIKTLFFHGDSMLDLNLLIPGLDNDTPVKTMEELMISRHLAPTYGKKTQIAPVSNDWLVIDKLPDILHTGHIHINGLGKYKNISLVNSGCFQAQTDFMKSFGIVPTPGIVPVIELDTMRGVEIDVGKF